MAKTKKTVQPSSGADSVDVNDGSKSSSKDKPAKNLKTIVKTPRGLWLKSDATEMVKDALKSLGNANLNQIRTHIKKIYNGGTKLSKDRLQLITEALRDHFDNGHIRMTNSDSKKIIFIMKFALVDDSE